MSGSLRLYDSYFQGLMRGRFLAQSDTYKLALVAATYVPNPTVADRQQTTLYDVGDVILVAFNGLYYTAATTGESGGGTPIYPTTYGATVTDGTVVWMCSGAMPPSSHAVWADVSANEVSDSIYPTGGVTLAGVSLVSAYRRSEFHASDISISCNNVTAKYAVLYKAGTVDSLTNPLVGYSTLNEAGSTVTVSAGYIRLAFAASGIFRVGV